MNERNSFYENQLQGLAERVAAQQQLGAQNMANARNVVQNAVNPYTAMQPTQSMSAGNPLAEYLRATGVDPTQSQSLVDLEAANNRNYDAAVANSLATLGAGYQQANDSRLADLALMEAGFASDLAGQENAIRAGLQSQQSAESQAIQDAITNMTLTQLGQEYGLTGDLLGFQNSQGSAIADAMLGQATAGQSFQQNQDNLQANRDNNSVNLLNNILSAYGGDLDPTSVVELVTTFANALGVPAAQVLGGVA
jgi:hypothetical protein